jgi:hypothetical protein
MLCPANVDDCLLAALGPAEFLLGVLSRQLFLSYAGLQLIGVFTDRSAWPAFCTSRT